METLFMWVGGISGLITVVAMLWRWAKRKTKPEQGVEHPPHWVISFGYRWQSGTSSEELVRAIEGAMENVELQPQVTVRKGQDAERWLHSISIRNALVHGRFPRATGAETVSPMEPPSAYRHLLRHLPPDLEDHREEMKDFVSDGISDRARAGKSIRGFVFSETLQLALFIGKVTIFKLRKSRRRTVS